MSKESHKTLNKVRERIEGFFNEIQHVGKNIEHLFAKKVEGLTTRIVVKMAAYTLKHYFRRFFVIDLLTFKCEKNTII